MSPSFLFRYTQRLSLPEIVRRSRLFSSATDPVLALII
ncbi:MAG: hypothetical protein JW395_3157 [Nitrospira sp.]|nr:hypothetical protein [Nitrospira sp.]